jgi:hypothetical protein
MSFRRIILAAFVMALAAMQGAWAQARFETRAIFAIPGPDPYSGLLGDFNRDGSSTRQF